MKPATLHTLKLVLVLCTILMPSLAWTQVFYDQGRQISGNDSIAYGNPNALFINPAFLGQSKGKFYTLQVLQMGFNGHSDFLNRNEVNDFAFSNDSIPTFDKNTWLELVDQNPLDAQVDAVMTWLTGSFASPGFGGLAISLTDRIRGSFLFGRHVTDLLLSGSEAEWLAQADTGQHVPIPADVSGDKLFYQHIRELHMGYGRKVFSTDGYTLYGGITGTYSWGIGLMDLQAENGTLTGVSAFSQFYDISYGSLGNELGDLPTKLLDDAGTGFTLGMGVSLNIQNKATVAASVKNLGTLNWREQVVRTETDSLFLHPNIAEGIGTFRWSEETDLIYDAFQFEPDGTYREKRAPIFRLNGFWRVRNDLTLSGDAVLTTAVSDAADQGNINIMLGLNYRPFFQMVNVNSGVLFNSEFGFRWPLGIAGNFGEGNTIVSISTNDVITILKNKQNPLSSLSIATLTQRF